MGARVIAVDLEPVRLARARNLAADLIVNAGDGDVVGAIRELTGGRGPTRAVEASWSAGGSPGGGPLRGTVGASSSSARVESCPST
jgi:threonine dehydrogenase-like Zn-dependent dehydrogenase